MYGIAPNLSEAISEPTFLNDNEHVNTVIGTVAKCKLNTVLPQDWRRLNRKQGMQIESQLRDMLGQWSIVAFSDGKIDGAGYGSKIHPTYGSQCGEMFVVKEQTAPQQYPPSHGGYQQFVMSDAPGFNKNHPVPSYLNPTNPNIQVKSFSPSNDLDSLFIKQYQSIQTRLGRVVKCKLNMEVPFGWRKLTRGEGQQIKQQLNTLIDKWSIVAFEDGKIDGEGYGNQIHSSYGSECGQMFVVNQKITQ